jgi:hypothetical protein
MIPKLKQLEHLMKVHVISAPVHENEFHDTNLNTEWATVVWIFIETEAVHSLDFSSSHYWL